MLANREHRRVLVVTESPEAPLPRLFASSPLAGWEAVPADGLGEAHFTLQHHPCELLLVDEAVYQRDGAESFHWLARRHEVPAVVLTAATAPAATAAYDAGYTWLPRDLVLGDPGLLAAALAQAARVGELHRNVRRLDEALRHSRRHIDRLVRLLWRTLPLDADKRWLSQRHMLERLQEEVSRTQRHGSQLTVVLGEVQLGEETATAAGEALPDWTADRITQSKRRCDVAGQYGLRGFMLLLVNTPAQGGVLCCRRLQSTLEGATAPGGPVRVCFGLVTLPTRDGTPQGLLRAAEERLDEARAGAGDRLVSG